jgi:hypothetical protein
MGQFTDVPYPRCASGIFALIFGQILSSLGNATFLGTFPHLWAGQFTDVPYPRCASGIFALIFGQILSSLGNAILQGTFKHLWIGDKIY